MIKKLLITLFLVCSLISNCFGDGNDSNTVSLLHMNGTDGSTTFTDDAAGGTHTWTASGNAQIDTAQSVFGGASGLFDGNGDYISTPDSDDFFYGTDPVTLIDERVRFSSLTNRQWLYFQSTADGTSQVLFRKDDTTNDLRFIAKSGGTTIAQYVYDWSPSINTWYHLVLARTGANLYLFIDGTSITWTTISTAIDASTSFPNIAATLYLGVDPDNIGLEDFTGWRDEVRISKGIARWTTSFTPPTEEYSAAAPIKSSVIWID